MASMQSAQQAFLLWSTLPDLGCHSRPWQTAAQLEGDSDFPRNPGYQCHIFTRFHEFYTAGN